MKIRHSVRYAVPLLLCMLGLNHAQPPPVGVPVPALGEGPWVFDVAEEETIRVSVVTQDLSHPWAIAFLPDGGMLITERPGRLRVVRDGVLDSQPISGVPHAARVDADPAEATHPGSARRARRVSLLADGLGRRGSPSNRTRPLSVCAMCRQECP